MKIITALLCTILFSLPNSAMAGVVTDQFNNGDSLADWTADRRAPAGFAIANNQLEMSIVGTDTVPNNFANTQGMQKSIGSANFLSIDMLIDQSWTLDQRYGGIWAIGHTASEAIGGWPIIEYQGPTTGFAVWDNLGWHFPVGEVINVGEFNNLMFKAVNAGIEYYINGNLVYTDASGDNTHFAGVILNAKNVGNDYTVVYDNLKYGNVPEPAPLALLGFGLLGLAFARKRRG